MADAQERVTWCHQNGIDFLSERFNQHYFERSRSARLAKKLAVGPWLKVIYSYEMTVPVEVIRAHYGVDYAREECWIIEDAMIDMSFRSFTPVTPHADRWLGFFSGDVKDGLYINESSWEIRAPDRATYASIIDALRDKLQAIIPHQGREASPPEFVHG